MKPTLVILAAGIGSRYGGLKQIDPVGPSGELIIDYSVFDAIRAGFGRVIFVINKKIEVQFRETIGNRVSTMCPVDYVCQRIDDIPAGYALPENRVKPWGTAHAVYCCRDLIDGPFAAINADDFYGAGAFEKVREFLGGGDIGDVAGDEIEDGAGAGVVAGDGVGAGVGNYGKHDCCMAGYLIENTLTEHGHVSRGVCDVSADDDLTGVTERIRIERRDGGIVYIEDNKSPAFIKPGTIVSMNMWGFPGQVMAEFERQFRLFLDREDIDLTKAEIYLPSVVNEMLLNNKARVKVLKTEDKWYGVTYLEDKEQVQRAITALVKSGKYPDRLWP